MTDPWEGVPRDGTTVKFFTSNGVVYARWSDTSHHGDITFAPDGSTARAGCWVSGSGLTEERVFLSGITGWAHLSDDRIEAAEKVAEALRRELDQVRAAIVAKGGTEHAPTQYAFDAACVALWRWRGVAEKLADALRAFDPQVIGSGPSTNMRMLIDAQQAARAALDEWEKPND